MCIVKIFENFQNGSKNVGNLRTGALFKHSQDRRTDFALIEGVMDVVNPVPKTQPSSFT